MICGGKSESRIGKTRSGAGETQGTRMTDAAVLGRGDPGGRSSRRAGKVHFGHVEGQYRWDVWV